MYTRFLILASTLFFLCNLVHKLDAQLRLTLEESVELALRQNPDLRIADHSIQQALYGQTQARSAVYPSLSAMGNYQRSWELPEFVFSPPPGFPGANGEIRVQMGVENTINSGLTFQQLLYSGGAITASKEMASKGVQASEYNFSSVRQRVIAEIYAAFHQILLTRKLINVADQSLKSAEENLRQVERLYNEGMASRFELLRAQVRAATVRPTVTEAHHRYDLAHDNLKNLLGVNGNTSIEIIGDFTRRAQTLIDAGLDNLIEQAYRRRPEYQIVQIQESMSRDGIRLARSNFMPRVVFSSSLNWQALQQDIHQLTGSDFTRSSTSQITVQLPIFNGFSDYARYQEAQVEYRKAEIQTENVRNLIATEIKALYKQLQQAKEILESQEEVVKQAEEGLRLANLLYEEGAATLLEVIDAQLAYTQASTSYYQATYNYNTTSISLERAVGILTADNLY